MSTPHFPGWYPDPDQSGRERLWDGQAWTHHLRKASGAPAWPAHDCTRDRKRCPRTAPHRWAGGLGYRSRPNRNRAPGSRKQSIRAADICSVHAAPRN